MSKENPKTIGTDFQPVFSMKPAEGKGPDLMPVIVQNLNTEQILMLAFATREALMTTLQTGKATFYSRSQNKIWTKGETSGNSLLVREILVDCDQDAVIYRAEPEKGGACDTEGADGQKRMSCFYRKLEIIPSAEPISPEGSALKMEESSPLELSRLTRLFGLLQQRFTERPEGSSTTKAFAKGSDFISLRIMQEAAELTEAVTKKRGEENMTEEASQLLYWFLVLLTGERTDLNKVLKKL